MVILRIWHPSQADKAHAGSSAITIAGVWGSAHISTRPVTGKVSAGAGRSYATATLLDDVTAEGGDTHHKWRFTRMDECKMLRVWFGLRKNFTTLGTRKYDPSVSFRTSDLILAAGRGIEVESSSTASFSKQAHAVAVGEAVATNFSQLHGRAEYYSMVEHW